MITWKDIDARRKWIDHPDNRIDDDEKVEAMQDLAYELLKERNEALAKAERLDKYLSERIDREVEKVDNYRKLLIEEVQNRLTVITADAFQIPIFEDIAKGVDAAERILSERKSKGVEK